ncbi:MAG: hypothetical protein PSV23_12145 [Brevundimonas sp.]|uniref:hypothetical protein n=1 Tax=Brevundimonas sp. TaxID=1871086 RepID=UPI0024898372|nr:hypothetical protein [Brevundimonas sp.]MDI1327534.1 hypothetical protein [Brevundimonas sp.]
MASQACRLLRLWNRIPGSDDEGGIDQVLLEDWIKEARAKAREIGRGAIADIQIGQMLATSPKGSDGIWPAEPVRAVIELFRSEELESGFRTGKYNLRGVPTRLREKEGVSSSRMRSSTADGPRQRRLTRLGP